MEKKKNPSAFIRNTYSILQRTDLNHIIAWNKEGNGFIIHDLVQFEALILPQYFKHQKYTSFVRQQVCACLSSLCGYCSQICMASISRDTPKLKTTSSINHFVGDRSKNFSYSSLSEIKRKPERKKKNDEQMSMNQFEIHENQIQYNVNEQRSENILSQQDLNPEQLNKRQGGAPDQNMKAIGWSLGSLCEQAILQNQILVKIHPILLSCQMKLKQQRIKQLRDQPIDVDYMNEMITSIGEIIKAQTMKLSSVFDGAQQ